LGLNLKATPPFNGGSNPGEHSHADHHRGEREANSKEQVVDPSASGRLADIESLAHLRVVLSLQQYGSKPEFTLLPLGQL